jgi:hypothetical protein
MVYRFTKCIKLPVVHFIPRMAAVPSSIPVKRRMRRRFNKTLTNVISTKVSAEDDMFLEQLTNSAYRVGAIKEPSKSEFLRLILRSAFDELKSRSDIMPFLLHKNNS